MYEKKLLNLKTGVISTEGTSVDDINCYVKEYEDEANNSFVLEGESNQGHKIYAVLKVEDYFAGKEFKDKFIAKNNK